MAKFNTGILSAADTYEETVQRAFITSFLVTYGYATLEIDQLEEEIFIKHLISSELNFEQAINVSSHCAFL